MPRPQKCRRVCAMPQLKEFCPSSCEEHCPTVILQVDEYEVIRLIDLDGFTQEECAVQMGVARTTVTNIYNRARRKLADVIVNGKRLKIQGGHFRLCDNSHMECKRPCCKKK